MKRFLFLLAVAALMIGPGIAVADGGWSDDFKKVLAAARKSGKAVVIEFTGSDWCQFCKRQRAEVFSTQEFKTWAAQKAELMIADFPSKEAPISEATRTQNEALKKQYNVAGFPTVLILDADGKEKGRLVGYQPGSGPAPWIKKANAILSQ